MWSYKKFKEWCRQLDKRQQQPTIIPAGAASEGVTTNGDGSISYRLTAADGKPQGSLKDILDTIKK